MNIEVDKPWLMLGDCLERMAEIPDGSVDMILCDLPYGTTACRWDAIIPMEAMWEHYRRVIKGNGAIVLTATQPFSSILVTSNLRWFKYGWVWNKELHTNFHQAKYQPLKVHEDVLVFGRGKVPYYPIRTLGKVNHTRTPGKESPREFLFGVMREPPQDLSGMKLPKSIQTFPKHPSQCGLHPSQKPLALFEYMIRTYTKSGETVLDNCFGSGTTGVACAKTGRKFIGIELDDRYFDAGSRRIESCLIENDGIDPAKHTDQESLAYAR
jgi:site-specific DNA-methyltransferase (adenine-specific)